MVSPWRAIFQLFPGGYCTGGNIGLYCHFCTVVTQKAKWGETARTIEIKNSKMKGDHFRLSNETIKKAKR